MKQRICVIILIIVFLRSSCWLVPAAEYTGASQDIGASGAIVLETDRGQVIYRKNADRYLTSHMAASIMIAILSIESKDMPSTITVSSILNESAYRTIDLEVGEKYSYDALLHVLILRSAPDITLIFADSMFTDTDKTIARMNEKASALGMKNTSFSVIKSGNMLFSCLTTLDDMSKLLLYCLRNSSFKDIFTSRIYLWPVGENDNEIITNSNDIIWRYENITGGMKSYSEISSKHSVITTSSGNGFDLLCILNDDLGPVSNDDTAVLFDYARENFRRGILAAKNQTLTEIEVNGTTIGLSPDKDIYYTYPIGQSFVENVTYLIEDDIEPPVMKNVSLGTATYLLIDGTVINVTLYPDTELLPKEDLFEKVFLTLEQNRDLFNVILFLLALETAVLIIRIFRLLKKIVKKRSQ